jgi:hypothetical protein
MMRRTVSMEARLVQLEQEIRTMRATLERLIENQPERILMPVQTPELHPKTGQAPAYLPTT